MATIDWLGWLLPALKLQLGWVDRRSSVLSPIPPEATAALIGCHLSRLSAPAAALSLAPATTEGFGPAPCIALSLPKPALLNFEGNTLVEVVSAPLLDALIVDTSVAGCVAVRERSGGAALCSLQTGGFDPAAPDSEASRQLRDLISKAGTRTQQDIELIQAQAATAWPFVVVACGRPSSIARQRGLCSTSASRCCIR